MNIDKLELFTNRLEKLRTFYILHLEFPLVEETTDSFIFQAGHSLFQFSRSADSVYYHFAFNIPSFSSREALLWLKSKVDILRDGSRELIDFFNWNAEAMYFADPAGNIVEFIARKNLDLYQEKPFSINSISRISEIGLPVDDVKKAFEQIHSETGTPHYWGHSSNFQAAGDEHGLFIIVDRNDKDWYPTDIPARAFPVNLWFRNKDTAYQLNFEEGKMKFS